MSFKLFIATPTYRDVKVDYHLSIINTILYLEDNKIKYQIEHVIGSSIIEDARNKAAHIFMKSDCTHLLFIDSDISWTTDSIVKLLNNKALPIIGGSYPKKQLNTTNFSLDCTGILDHSMFSPIDDDDNSSLVKVKHLGMGFTMIRRSVLESFINKFPDNFYIEEDENVYRFFYCDVIDHVGYGEDTNFCRIVRDAL